MSIDKPNVGDLFYEAFMEALAEEAAPPKKETNKQFSNTTIQTPASLLHHFVLHSDKFLLSDFLHKQVQNHIL